jgi:integral membrane protein
MRRLAFAASALDPPDLRTTLRPSMGRRNPIPFLRRTGLVEGLSFLLLLGVAMPLKYVAGYPLAVKVAGWVHGVLFIVFCAALLRTMIVAQWSAARGALVLIAALLPFGPIVLDRRMKRYEADFQGAAMAEPRRQDPRNAQ